MKKKIILFFFFLNLFNYCYGSTKIEIINNLKNINNISFDFKQTINDKIEEGNYKTYDRMCKNISLYLPLLWAICR